MNIDNARATMIEQQIRPWEVLDPRVLSVLGQVRREDFVPVAYRRQAFTDVALPLAHGQVMMKPAVEGRVLQALDLDPSDDVLEIGTGSGFLTACLARLARAVTSIDLHADLIDGARARLIDCGAVNVKLDVADALAFEPHHQFDAVCVTAAVAKVPAQFLEWLKPDGRMFIVSGISPAQQALRMTRRGAGCHTEQLFETDIPYLRGAAPVPRFAL